MSTFRTTIERNTRGCDCEVDIVVQYIAEPLCKGSLEEPEAPARIVIEAAHEEGTGIEVELTTAQESWIEQQIAEELADAELFAREQHYDFLRDQKRGL